MNFAVTLLRIEMYLHHNDIYTKAYLNIESLLGEFNISYKRTGDRIFGACPIHSGDNYGAWNLYLNSMIWKCYTHQCEVTYGKDFIGFIRGILSTINHQSISRKNATDWLCEKLGAKPDGKPTLNDKLTSITSILEDSGKISKSLNIKRWQIRKLLQIPAEYFLNRGFSPKILDKYDVGLYSKNNRITVPIYDDSYAKIIGLTTRKINDEDKKRKWIHTNGILTGNHLYNYWFAKPYIEKSRVAILVEGVGDVWKFEEANIHNSVSLMGVSLSENHQKILEQSGVMLLYLCLDNDEAGKCGRQIIKSKLKRLFTIKEITYDKKDVGELTMDYINNNIKPQIIERYE